MLIHPGETLAEVLADRGTTPAQLAMTIDSPEVVDVVNGWASITPELATKLEHALGVPASFWVNLEANYQADRERFGLRD